MSQEPPEPEAAPVSAPTDAGTPAPAERTAAAPVSAPNDATMMERIMACIPPNPRRMGYIDPIHGPLDEPLYMGSHIHQQLWISKN